MKTATISKPKKSVFEALKEACQKLNLNIKSADLKEGKLSIVHDGNFLSFGNIITATVTAKSDKSILKIASESAAPIQLIDWGLNKDLEDRLIKEVKNILKG